MSKRRRVEHLESQWEGKSSRWETPLYVRVYLKTIERLQARDDGKELPPYSREELAHLRQDDLETVAGGGVVGAYRTSLGWQSEEARTSLDAWEEEARRRLEAAEGLPPERWHEVGGVDEEVGSAM